MSAAYSQRSEHTQRLCHSRWRLFGWKGGNHIPKVDPCGGCAIGRQCIGESPATGLSVAAFNKWVDSVNSAAERRTVF